MTAATLSRTRPARCVCGARLRWVRYVPKDVPPDSLLNVSSLSVIPLDWQRPQEGTRAWDTANYAVAQGTVLARQITAFRPLDDAVEWGPFNVHFATCPKQVTAEQLVQLGERTTSRSRRHRR